MTPPGSWPEGLGLSAGRAEAHVELAIIFQVAKSARALVVGASLDHPVGCYVITMPSAFICGR